VGILNISGWLVKLYWCFIGSCKAGPRVKRGVQN